MGTLESLVAKQSAVDVFDVQAFMDVYTRFTRSDGSVVWLHMPCGDGQRPTSSPGNLYSSVVQMRLDGKLSGLQNLTLDQMIPYPAGTILLKWPVRHW